MQALQRSGLQHQAIQGIIAGVQKRGPQQQIFWRITAHRELRGEKELGAGRMRRARGGGNLLGIAPEVTHSEIELGHLQVQGHGLIGFEREKRW
jgi:hypothetical protein